MFISGSVKTGLLTGVFVALLMATPCAAQQPGFHSYGPESGIPRRQITAVYQDRNGILWIGTYTGIIRFNGTWAEVIDTADGLPNSSISGIIEDSEGRLCFGTFGGGLIVRDGDVWQTFATSEYLPDNWVVALAAEGDGALWIATEKGISRLGNKGATVLRYGTELPFGYCYDIARDSSGEIWLGTDKGLFRHRQGVFQQISFTTNPDDTHITSLAAANGSLWATAGGRIYRLEDKALIGELLLPAGDAQYVNTLCIDYHGNLWIGTWAGAFVYQNNTLRHYTAAHGLNHAVINQIYPDRVMNLWFGTEDGLARLSPGIFVFYDSRTGLAGDDALHTAEDNRGRLWVATDQGVSILDGDTWSRLTTADGLADNYATCLAARADGRMIIITDSAVHEWRNGRIRVLDRNHDIVCTMADSQDRVWFGTYSGLYRLEGDRIIRHAPHDLLKQVYINALAEDAWGRLWIATNRDGCLVLEGDRLQIFNAANGLTDVDIWALRRAPDGSMWLGTNGAGAYRWKDGVFRHYTRAEGLSSNYVWQVLPDDRGGVWFGTNQGVDLLRGDRFTHFNRNDGLAADEGTQDNCLQDSSGRIWFGSSHGLSLVQHYPETDEARPVAIRIEEVRLDDQPLNVAAPVTIPPASGALLIRYAGITYVDNERLRYRFRLQGSGRDWSTIGRDADIQFSELPPGNYLFQVAATIDGGRTWSATPASLAIVVEPFFYQTWWFMTLCAVSVLALLFAGHSLRLRKEQQTAIRLEKVVAEKTAELHTRNVELSASVQELEAFTHMVSHDLRAPLTRIKGFMGLLKTAGDIPGDGESATYLERIRANCSRMDEMIRDLLRFSRAGRQAISLENVDLSLLVRDIVRTLQQSDAYRAVEVRQPQHLMVRTDARLIRIVLENLLDNAWKYSAGRTDAIIEVGSGFSRDGEQFYYVRDNGVGFDNAHKDRLFALFSRLHDDASFSGLGLGLVTAHRIVTRLGGRIWAESEEDQGATFYFTLP